MGSDEIKVAGLSELKKMLEGMPANVEKNIMRGAVRKGTKYMETIARNYVPVKTGALKKSIRTSVRIVNGDVRATLKVGGKGARHAHLIEFGTKPHLVKSPDGVLKVFGKFFKSVQHPGSRMRPFMRPALDAGRYNALNVVAEYVRLRINRANLKIK